MKGEMPERTKRRKENQPLGFDFPQTLWKLKAKAEEAEMSTGFRRNESDLPAHTFTLTSRTDQGWGYKSDILGRRRTERQVSPWERFCLPQFSLCPAHLRGPGREEAPVKPQTVQSPSSREDLWFATAMKSNWGQALPNYPLHRIDMAAQQTQGRSPGMAASPLSFLTSSSFL